MNDALSTYDVILQENGIVRNLEGAIIGRLDRDNKMDRLQQRITELEAQLKEAQEWMEKCDCMCTGIGVLNKLETAEAKCARYREALEDIADGNDNYCTDCQYNERIAQQALKEDNIG